MAKRTFENRKREESDSSSSEELRLRRVKKRAKRNRKSFPGYANADSTASNKSQMSDFKTSTPKDFNRKLQNGRSAVSRTGRNPKHAKSESDDLSSEELIIKQSECILEEKKSDRENDSYRDGFLSFMKRFEFFSEGEDNLTGNVVLEPNKPNSEHLKNDISDDSDTQEPLADASIMSRDMLTADNAESMVNNYRKLTYHNKNVEVLFLKNYISIPMVGNLKVTLLAGRATILGYSLTQLKPVNIFSQKHTGILTIDIVPHDKLNKQTMKIVRKHLKGLLGEELTPEIRNNCREVRGVFSTVIVLEEQILSPPLEFLEYYLPEAVYGVKFNVNTVSYAPVLDNSTHIIDLSEEHEELFTKIEQHVHRISKKKSLSKMEITTSDSTSSEDEKLSHDAQLDTSEIEVVECQPENGIETKESKPLDDTNPCIFIYGPKRSGKSTMLRYLINKFLNVYSEIFYLDTDPGQSEFTPPGSVSLTRVTEPVFGPSFTHLRHPEKMIFTGSVTSETSPTMYVKSVTYLIDYFLRKYPGKILLINTMGWITGLGDMMLQYIKNAARPSVEIELQAERLALKFTNPKNKVLKCKAGFHRDPATATKKGDFTPGFLRDASLLAYFGRCQKSYLPLTPMNALQPQRVCWENIFLYHFDKRLDNHRFYQAINCSIVGLCKVDESLQLLSTSEDYPNTLEDEPLNNCLGYGLVRSIDESNRLLYVITPLSLDTLQHVNAAIGGNILVPEMVLLKQPVDDTELYYTDKSVGGPTAARKAIRRRARMNTTLLN